VKVLYPIYATTFIWAAVIAWMRHGTPIEPIHAGGMALLMIGVVCMSW
jgi:drug/metabolite transporter (DMT)-like permease